MLVASLTAAAGCASAPRHYSPEGAAARINGGDLAAVHDVWYQLGMKVEAIVHKEDDVFTTAGRPEQYAAGPFSAQVFRMINLDGQGDLDAIVRIADPGNWDWQLLVFVSAPREPGGWKCVGKVDLPGHRYGSPEFDTVSLGPSQAWLVVTSQRDGAPGEAISCTMKTWYEVRYDRLMQVLRLPASGHRSGPTLPFEVAYRAEVTDVFLTPDNLPGITARVEAIYTNARTTSIPTVTELFTRQGEVRYVQSKASGLFLIDPGSTAWTQAEIDGLPSDNAEGFLQHNFSHVFEMARSGDPARREWVGRLLLQCTESAEKRDLTAVLDGAP
jgi:hypothetical protein